MNTFRLEILTPERRFLDADVELVGVQACDGRLTVLAGHAPMVAPLDAGTLHLRLDGEDREAFHSLGFLEVRPDKVLMFTQACEWPEEIDEKRALEAEQRAHERLQQQRTGDDLGTMGHSKVALMRAMTRQKIKSMSSK